MKFFRQNEEGYALIIVLWAIVILAVIFVSLAEEVQLTGLLLRNNLEQRKLEQAAISAVNMAVVSLKQDQTEYDSRWDQWAEPVRGELDGIVYQIEIKDIGSKLNINFAGEKVLAASGLFAEQMVIKQEEGLIPELFFIKDRLAENYQQAEKLLTCYGSYNINGDSLEGIEGLLKLAGLGQSQIKLIQKSLEKLREDEVYIKTKTEIPVKVSGFDLTTFNRIKPYLTTEGQININFASEEVIRSVIRGLGIESVTAGELQAYLKRKEVRKLEELQSRFLVEKEFNQFKNYFTCSSRYFLLGVKVSNMEEEKSKEAEVVVERRMNQNSWQLKIIKWTWL